jgi:hypothetical protein
MDAVSPIFAMQRANGDWFALAGREGLRVPVFSSNSEAMKARSFNVEMLVFHPVIVDESALKGFASAAGEPAARVWLVKQGSTNMKRGAFLESAELARLVHGTETMTAKDSP